MFGSWTDWLNTLVAAWLLPVPGETFEAKLELVANILGIIGFVLSLGLLVLGPLFRWGRRRPATRGDLERLGSAVVDMIGDRLGNRLVDRVGSSIERAHDLMTGPFSSTEARVREDLQAAIAIIAEDPDLGAQTVAAGLLRGEVEPAEDYFANRASRAKKPREAAEALHFQSVLLSLRDEAGAVAPCRQALELSPNDALGWSRLGHLYLRLGRAEEARNAFDRAVALQAGSGA